MWQSVVIVSAFLAAASGFTISGPEITQCVMNKGALPLAASVAGCNATPCILQELQDAVVDIIFQAPHDISTMTITATAYLNIFGMQIPLQYDLAEKSVTCNYLLNSSCPVREGDVLLYTLRMYIGPLSPVGPVTIEFTIQDDRSEAVMCVRVPADIQLARP